VGGVFIELIQSRIDRERSEIKLNESFMKRTESEIKLNNLGAKRIKNEISLQEINLKLKLMEKDFTRNFVDKIDKTEKDKKENIVSYHA